jgi:hypothetical protein
LAAFGERERANEGRGKERRRENASLLCLDIEEKGKEFASL